MHTDFSCTNKSIIKSTANHNLIDFQKREKEMLPYGRPWMQWGGLRPREIRQRKKQMQKDTLYCGI